MRQIDKDEAPALGRKIEKPAMPVPHVKVREGVYRAPDGKHYTDVPANEAANSITPSPSPWDAFFAAQRKKPGVP